MTSHRVPELRFGQRTVTTGGNAQNTGGKSTARKTFYDLAKIPKCGSIQTRHLSGRQAAPGAVEMNRKRVLLTLRYAGTAGFAACLAHSCWRVHTAMREHVDEARRNAETDALLGGGDGDTAGDDGLVSDEDFEQRVASVVREMKDRETVSPLDRFVM